MFIVSLTQIGKLQIAKMDARFAASLAAGFEKVRDATVFRWRHVVYFLTLGANGENKHTGCDRTKAKT